MKKIYNQKEEDSFSLIIEPVKSREIFLSRLYSSSVTRLALPPCRVVSMETTFSVAKRAR